MAWNDRLREAAYTSPGGTRITFDYEDVSQRVEKKTTGFEFPDASGTYVQDLGNTGRKYPLRVIFWGADYDIEIAAFEALLLEQGIGRLEHPIYGTIDVVPFGAITRRDDLKTAANQGVLDVTFWETIPLVYPTSQFNPASDVLSAVGAFNNTATSSFSDLVDLAGAVEKAVFENEYLAVFNSVVSEVTSVVETTEEVQQQFSRVKDSIVSSIDALIDAPGTLAAQTLQLIQLPAYATGAEVSARVDSYRSLSDAANQTAPETNNQLQTSDLFNMGYVSGAVMSSLNTQFTVKTDALAVADQILDQFDAFVVWRDTAFQDLTEIDTGEAYQKLQEAVATCIGFLVEISFTLKQERRVVLTRNRTIIDLTAELYGAVDTELDFFISSNQLSGSEILELPKGREIVYYV